MGKHADMTGKFLAADIAAQDLGMFPKLLILLSLSKSSSSFGSDCTDFVTPFEGVEAPLCTTLPGGNRGENLEVLPRAAALDFDSNAFGIFQDLDLLNPNTG